MNFISEYTRQINDGRITAGKWIHALYAMIENGLAEGLFFYDDRKAQRAIKFVENFAHHHEGPLAPGLIRLELWQKALLSVIFGVVDVNGNRQFREVLIVMGRKNGKTLLSSAVAEYMAFADGEYGARIYFAAPKLQQATLCFNAFFQSIRNEPELDALAQKRRTDVYIESTNSSAQPLAFNANTSDGLNISCCVADEIASWRGDAGLKYYEVLKSSFGARVQPLLLGITTAGYENEGIYDELLRRSTRVLLGDSQETRFAPFLYMIDDVDAWDDLHELEKSNPNIDVSITRDYLQDEIAIAEGSLSKKAEFITKHGCIKQNSSSAWLSTQTVNKCVGEHISLESLSHSYAVCGIDLSQTTDLTSACVVVEKDGVLHVVSKFWLPSAKIDEATERDGIPYRIMIQKGFLEPSGENFIDYEDCYKWLISLVKNYEILPLVTGYDRYSARYLITALEQAGFKCDDVYQGDNLWTTMQQAEGLMKDGKIKIGDNDLLRVHFLDSAVKMNNERGRGKLVKVSKTAHVDGMAALLDALVVREKWFGQFGTQLANKRG